MQLEKLIKKDVRKWSQHFLEIPNKHLGGFPACPFAKKTWDDKKVLVEVKKKYKFYKSQLNQHLEKLNFDKHEILIFCDPYFNYSLDEFQSTIDSYNNWYNSRDIYFMGFHPKNPANEEEQEFLVTPSGDMPVVDSDLEYSMMLIQKFSQLQEASDKLHRIGYYKLWPTGYYQDVVVSRQKTYKRIFGGQNGNEEKIN
jgi:hypothetical protein|tara:strand:+ start:762 stop:1355 length:594 start_codon:yes stop_codon:yes gene_type:complete